MNTAKKVRYSVISLLVVGILIAVGFMLYNILVFRVTHTNPDRAEFPTIAPYIDIYFSKPVDRVSSYALNKETTGSIAIDQNRIRFTPAALYETDKSYTLELKGIYSKSGDTLDYSYVFTAIYMNFSQVPEDIQKASIEKSSSGQIDDPFFNNYFPMQTKEFQIEHPYDSVNSKKVLEVTFLSEVYNYDTNTKQNLSNSEAELVRQRVINYIKDKGGKPEEYDIFYSNEYLENKYNKEHSSHQPSN